MSARALGQKRHSGRSRLMLDVVIHIALGSLYILAGIAMIVGKEE